MKHKFICILLLAIAAVCWGQQEEAQFGEVREHYDKITNVGSIGMMIDITMGRTDGYPTDIMWLQFVRTHSPDVPGPNYYMILFMGAQEWWFIESVRTLADGKRQLFEIHDSSKDYSAKGVQEVCLFVIDLDFIKRIAVAKEVLLRFNGKKVMGTYELSDWNKRYLEKYLLKIEEKSGGV